MDNLAPPKSKGYNGGSLEDQDSKVATPNKFAKKKGGEVYKWFAQLRLVFQGKRQAYHYDEDKIAYSLSYINGAVQKWAMPILQALDEGRPHELLVNYNTFREVVIAVYRDIDPKSTADDALGRV